MIKTYPLKERILRGLFGQDWCGRFELYIDGKLRGTYNQSGGELLGSGEYTVAKIELNIEHDIKPDPTQKELLEIINRLQNIPGMTPANSKDVQYSTAYILLKNKFKINMWKNLAGVDHVFVLDSSGNCCFAGYVGWIHAQKFYQTLQQIQNDFSGV
jgi:hypothetical protein